MITTNMEEKYKKLTPRQQMKLFVADKTTLSEEDRALRNKLLNDMVDWEVKKGFLLELVIKELKKFRDYWTELNGSGTKQRWEKETTFEIKRRFWQRWMVNVAERMK